MADLWEDDQVASLGHNIQDETLRALTKRARALGLAWVYPMDGERYVYRVSDGDCAKISEVFDNVEEIEELYACILGGEAVGRPAVGIERCSNGWLVRGAEETTSVQRSEDVEWPVWPVWTVYTDANGSALASLMQALSEHAVDLGLTEGPDTERFAELRHQWAKIVENMP